MEQTPETTTMTLAHWTYTQKEWTAFVRKTKSQKGFIAWLFHFFTSIVEKKTPEIKITRGRVWVGNDFQYFNNGDHQLKAVRVHEEDNMNILEITYQAGKSKRPSQRKISLPVPKGKLREAFEVEERLTSINQPG